MTRTELSLHYIVVKEEDAEEAEDAAKEPTISRGSLQPRDATAAEAATSTL